MNDNNEPIRSTAKHSVIWHSLESPMDVPMLEQKVKTVFEAMTQN